MITKDAVLCMLRRCCCCCYVTSVMFESVRPHRWQPTRLLCPWDSPRQEHWSGSPLPSPFVFVTPRTVAHQVPLSLGFSRQEYCSGLPFSPLEGEGQGTFLTQGSNPCFIMSPAFGGGFVTTSTTWEAPN